MLIFLHCGDALVSGVNRNIKTIFEFTIFTSGRLEPRSPSVKYVCYLKQVYQKLINVK